MFSISHCVFVYPSILLFQVLYVCVYIFSLCKYTCVRPTGQNFNLRQLGICEPATRRGLAFCAEMGLPHRGFSVGAGSDVDHENEGVMSPERAMRLWGRGVKSGRNSCLSSRSNSALTLTDTEHENKSDSDNGKWRRTRVLFILSIQFQPARTWTLSSVAYMYVGSRINFSTGLPMLSELILLLFAIIIIVCYY